MKRIILITLCLTMSLGAMAQWHQQGGGGDRDRRQFSPENYNKELESFVTRDAGLTESEAQRLFPMIHEMLELERKNNMEATRLMGSCDENSSEADYERTLKKCLALEIDNKTIEQTYYKKFHSVLSWKKIHKVRGALFKFNMYALRRFSAPRQGGQHGRWNNRGPGGTGTTEDLQDPDEIIEHTNTKIDFTKHEELLKQHKEYLLPNTNTKRI